MGEGDEERTAGPKRGPTGGSRDKPFYTKTHPKKNNTI